MGTYDHSTACLRQISLESIGTADEQLAARCQLAHSLYHALPSAALDSLSRVTDRCKIAVHGIDPV